MSNSSYPALLNKRARIFVTLNRADLVLLGLNFLICSKLGLSTVWIMSLCLVQLIANKFIEQNVEKGFFKNLLTKRHIDWKQEVGRISE